jgi:uncharacterized protein
MKLLKFLLIGFVFGIVLTKSEAVSWYRIYEMFQLQSFHMYGIIMTAIVTGIFGIQVFKFSNIKGYKGIVLEFYDKDKGTFRYWVGGLIFGLGWALVGACPGPIFILIGAGFMSVWIILIGALIGTFLYGLIRDKLPH